MTIWKIKENNIQESRVDFPLQHLFKEVNQILARKKLPTAIESKSINQKKKTDKERIYGLDILRALAILFVVYGHGGTFFPDVSSNLYSLPIYDGVAVFFVLSGFLIGSILLNLYENEKKFTVQILLNFWIRRWFRTLPNYFLVLFVIIIINWENISSSTILKYYFFVQNLFYTHPNFYPEAWSLSIEEWFYLLFPLLLYFSYKLFKNKFTENKILILIISTIILITLIRLIKSFFYMDQNQVIDYGIHFRGQVLTQIDSIAFGVLGSYFKYYYSNIWKGYKNICFYAGLLLVLLTKSYFHWIIYIDQIGIIGKTLISSVMSMGILLILPKMHSMKYSSGVIYKIISHISLISYSMYLISLTIVACNLKKYIILGSIYNNLVYYIFYWSIVLIISTFLYKYWEKPMMDIRDLIVKK